LKKKNKPQIRKLDLQSINQVVKVSRKAKINDLRLLLACIRADYHTLKQKTEKATLQNPLDHGRNKLILAGLIQAPETKGIG
jgi:hypothetical protein